jgi:hypothetical protein
MKYDNVQSNYYFKWPLVELYVTKQVTEHVYIRIICMKGTNEVIRTVSIIVDDETGSIRTVVEEGPGTFTYDPANKSITFEVDKRKSWAYDVDPSTEEEYLKAMELI